MDKIRSSKPVCSSVDTLFTASCAARRSSYIGRLINTGPSSLSRFISKKYTGETLYSLGTVVISIAKLSTPWAICLFV